MGYAPAKGYTDKVYIYLHSYCKTLSALYLWLGGTVEGDCPESSCTVVCNRICNV